MQVLRVLATPRWVGWTLLAICAVIVCGGMAYWQLLRAESPTGSVLNAGYAFQWPLFGVFFAALWWRMLRAEAAELTGIRDGGPDDEVVGPSRSLDGALPGIPSPFTPRPAGVAPGEGQGDPARGRARTDYNAMLAALARADADRQQQEEER